ncbi:MAG: hypothetical protein IJO87_06740 [Eggerthellaceae bacterium]|nr:hypothetical protein [Eggerthellaceae bacterium]
MIILSHITAFHCLRHFGAEAVAFMPRVAFSAIEEPFDDALKGLDRYLAFCESAGMEAVFLHLLRPRGSHLTQSDCLITHSSGDLSKHSLLKVSEGVYCVQPELLVRQLSSLGSVCEVTYLLYELCGTYSHPGNVGIDLLQRKSFTTKERLQRYANAMAPFPHLDVFLEAVSLVKERSASPMETACAMLLGLPYRLGGLSFPEFEMNKELIVPQRLIGEVGRRRMIADLCWPNLMVTLEYDSKEWHHGAEQVARDAGKRNAMQRMGYRVVTLTGMQAESPKEIMRVSRILSEAVGHRIRPRVKDFASKREALEHLVLRDKGASFGAAKVRETMRKRGMPQDGRA